MADKKDGGSAGEESKRAMGVPLSADGEAKVRKIAQVTGKPLAEVRRRLGAKAEKAIPELRAELAAEAKESIDKDLTDDEEAADA